MIRESEFERGLPGLAGIPKYDIKARDETGVCSGYGKLTPGTVLILINNENNFLQRDI